MKHLLKRAISSAYYFLQRRDLFTPNKKMGFRILLYHSIDNYSPDDYLGIRMTPENFLKQMELLYNENFKVCRVQQLVDFLKERKEFPKKAVAIAFDDGYRDNLKNVLPVLIRYNFPATIFLRSDLLDVIRSNGMYYWEKWDYLSQNDLKELIASGIIDIGSHGIYHRKLTSLPQEELIKEIAVSKEKLENITGRSVQLFSYPYGIVDDRVKDIVRQAGYKAAFSSNIGINEYTADVFELRRTEINAGDDALEVKKKLSGSYDWLSYFQKIKKGH